MAETKPALRDPKSLLAPFYIFIILVTLLALALNVTSSGFYYISKGDPNWTPTDYLGDALAIAVLGLSLVSLGAFIGAVIFTLTITFRMVRNLKIIGSGHMTMSPFWSAAFYFVPFANLVMPANAITEVWKGTYAEIEDAPPEPNGAIAWWWGPWLLSNILDNVAARFLGAGLFQEPTQPSPEMLTTGIALSIVASLALIVSCFSMAALFGRLAKAQSRMIEVVKRREASA
jgi:hypothetical protein